jgi:hypothetical protein
LTQMSIAAMRENLNLEANQDQVRHFNFLRQGNALI